MAKTIDLLPLSSSQRVVVLFITVCWIGFLYLSPISFSPAPRSLVNASLTLPPSPLPPTPHAPLVLLRAVSKYWGKECLLHSDISTYSGLDVESNWTRLDEWEQSNPGKGALVHFYDGWGVQLYEKRKAKTPIIVDTGMQENWGNFASPAPGTDCWTNLTETLMKAQRLHGTKTIWEAPLSTLNDPRILVILSTQHRSFYHPKIVTVPLGVRNCDNIQSVGAKLLNSSKSILLFANWDAMKQFRFVVARCIKKRFGELMYWPSGLTFGEHLTSMAKAKYVLSTPGLGMDAYRTWETLWMGSIPILLAGFGFESLFSDLPALFVKEYSEVTPELLEDRYASFAAKADTYNYAKLTKEWWYAQFDHIVATKNATQFLRHFVDPPEYLKEPRSQCEPNEYTNYNTSCPWGELHTLPTHEATKTSPFLPPRYFCTKTV